MGFDIDCVIDIHTYPGGFFCPVCRTLVYPQEALQSRCKHLYCKPCLAHIANGSRICPYDGYSVTESDCKPLMVSDIELAKRIDNVKVHCLYFRSGCKWEGSLSQCTSHCLGCLFGNSQVLCIRCGLIIIHRHGQDHAQSCSGAKRAQYAGCDANQQSNQPFYHVQQLPVPLQAQQQSHVYTKMPQQFHPSAAPTLSTAYLSTQLPAELYQLLHPHPITQTEHPQQLQSHVLEQASPQIPVQLQLPPPAQSHVQVPPRGQTNTCAPEQVLHQQEPQVSQDQLPWWNLSSPRHSQMPVQLQLPPQAQSHVQVPPRGQTNICAPEQVLHQQEPQVSQDQLLWWNLPSLPHSEMPVQLQLPPQAQSHVQVPPWGQTNICAPEQVLHQQEPQVSQDQLPWWNLPSPPHSQMPVQLQLPPQAQSHVQVPPWAQTNICAPEQVLHQQEPQVSQDQLPWWNLPSPPHSQMPVQLRLPPQAQSHVQVPPWGQTNICAPEQVLHQQEPQVSQDQLPWWNLPSPPHSQVNQPVPYAREMSMQNTAQNSQIPQYQQPRIQMPNPQASQAQLHCQNHPEPHAYAEISNQCSQIEQQFHHVQPPTDPLFFPVVQPIQQSDKYDKWNIKPCAPEILDGENHDISSHKIGGYDVNVREAHNFVEDSIFCLSSNSVGDPFHDGRFPPMPDYLKRGATICVPWTPSFGEHIAPDLLHKGISSDEVFGKDEHDGHLMFKELSCPGNSNMFDVAGHDATPINSHVGVLGVSGNFHPHPPFDESVGGEVSNFQHFEEPVMRNNYFTLPSKRKHVSTGWCPICKIDCQTAEGLDIHSQSSEHQIRAMDLAKDIMQQSKKKQRTFAGPASHNEGSSRTMEAGNNP